MKKQIFMVLAVFLLPLPLVLAQGAPSAVADIPFSFILEGKTLPAGTYSFTEGDNPSLMAVRNSKTGQALLANVITRISTPNENEADIVFDVTGNDHYLSEVHMPGVDGYLLKATPGKHTHTHIKGKKQAKPGASEG